MRRQNREPKMLAVRFGAKWPQAKGCQQPPEAGGGKGQILMQSCWREHSPADALILAQ